MKLYVPFRSKKRELAETKQTRSSLSSEIGVAGEVVFTGYRDEEARTDSIPIKTYREMLDKDPTVESLYNIFTLPVVAATYRIEADEQDAGGVQADFIRRNLLEPPHKGGMELPFSLFLDQLLLAVVDGFQLWERVYRIDADGRLALKKLAHRDSIGITLKRDKVIGYNGAAQRVNYMGEYEEIDIPPYKTFLFTHNKARSFLYGRSAFTSLYPKYDKKKRLEYLDSISLQSDAIKAKLLKRTEAGDLGKDGKKARDKALDMLTKLGEMKPVGSIPYGFDVDVINSEGRSPHESIERQNSEMARAFLATFALLGSQGQSSNVGSYALSDNLSDMMLTSIKGFMTKIEEHINQYLIADLIDLNFAEKHYPTFKFDDITSDVVSVMTEAFQKLLEKDKISDEMVQGIEEAAANRLDINLDAIKKQREEQDKKDTKESEKQITDNKEDTDSSQDDTNDNNGNSSLSDAPRWHRELTIAEKTVKFAELNERMDTLEQQFIDQMKPITDVLAPELATKASEAQSSMDIDVELPPSYGKVIAMTIKTAFNYGKTASADEDKVDAPATTKEDIANIQEQTAFIVEKQQDDLKNLLRSEYMKAERTNQPVNTGGFIDALAASVSAWFATKLVATAGAIVPQAINDGRARTFDATANKNDLFQWSALLDGKCSSGICPPLDGKVIDRSEYASTPWKPKLHYNCRCILVRIRKLASGKIDTEIPKVTGFPSSSNGFTGPQL